MADHLVPAQPESALPVLIGRDQPLARVAALCDAARAGHGRVVLVTGEAGMGKTRFAEAVAEAATQRGMRVAWGWCSHEDAPPYGPWSPALRTLNIELPVPPALPSSATVERQRRFIEVVEQLRERAVRIPLLLVLEDLHCADVPSLRLLRVVADATPASSLLVLGTCRDDPLESSPEVWRLLAGLPPVVERVVLAGLDAASTRRVAADALGAPLPAEIVDSLYERTGGNPFFAREVAHLIASRGGERGTTVPTGVAELLQRRLARLCQECHAVLDVAAVAGEDAEVA
jgi:predicted ATPase